MAVSKWLMQRIEQAKDRAMDYSEIVHISIEHQERDLPNFIVWTEERIYFPATYDANNWVESVPRNPCDETIEPVGG